MKKFIFSVFCSLSLIALIPSCKKTDSAADNSVITTAEDLSANTDYAEQVDVDADLVLEDRGGGGCPTITFAQPEGTWPNTITIDFGSACTRPDGRVLSGKLIINQSAEIRTIGAVRTLSHDNFYIDGIKVEGTRTWTNGGQNAQGQWFFTKTAVGMKLTFTDGSSTTWNKTGISTLIEGGNTATYLDDVWSSQGTATGVNRNGKEFTATVTEPLIKKADCRWISSGVIEMTVESRTRSLDFGDGDCDRLGTVTLANGDSFTIRLRR